MGMGELASIFILMLFRLPRVFNSSVTAPFAQPMNLVATSVLLGIVSAMFLIDSKVQRHIEVNSYKIVRALGPNV